MSGPLLSQSSDRDLGAGSLEELEARFRRECQLLLVPPAKAWLEPRVDKEFGPVLDVAIIGAGMAGLAVAMSLKRVGITNVTIFDRAPEGFEGPWVTYARMQLLRSPPELTGPALNFPSLAFRAWFEAQFGSEAWPKLYRIPRTQWMEYLRWYRRVTEARIENLTEVVDVNGSGDQVLLALRSSTGERRVLARRVVLATGRDGLGGPYVPELFQSLDKRLWAHSSEDIDFRSLKGKAVGVVGAGASATDNAAEALEHGAGRVAMLVRRKDVPRINRGMGIGSPGLWHGFYQLTPEQRHSIVQYIDDQAIPPPRASMLRCSRHPNFSLIAGCEMSDARTVGEKVKLDTKRGRLVFDFVILATGFAVDWEQRPELGRLRQHVAVWSDRFQPPGHAAFSQGESPFLGPGLEFQERTPGAAPWVKRIHCFAFPAFLSHGAVTGDIPAIGVGAERIATSIAASLFAEDYDRLFAQFLAWDKPELLGDEYRLSEDVSAYLSAEEET